MPPTTGHSCSRLAVQKLGGRSYDYRAADFYRAQAWRRCGVDPTAAPDTVFVEQHGGELRRWQRDTLRLMIQTLRASPLANSGQSERAVSFGELSNMTYCEQVGRSGWLLSCCRIECYEFTYSATTKTTTLGMLLTQYLVVGVAWEASPKINELNTHMHVVSMLLILVVVCTATID